MLLVRAKRLVRYSRLRSGLNLRLTIDTLAAGSDGYPGREINYWNTFLNSIRSQAGLSLPWIQDRRDFVMVSFRPIKQPDGKGYPFVLLRAAYPGSC
jgi:hypothetical protein